MRHCIYKNRQFSEFEKKDICRSYRLAKYPKKQIFILADLYSTSKENITAVIEEGQNIIKENQQATIEPVQQPQKEAGQKTVNQKQETNGPASHAKSQRTNVMEHAEEIIAMKQAGKTAKEITEKTGVSSASIYRVMEKMRTNTTTQPIAEKPTKKTSVESVTMTAEMHTETNNADNPDTQVEILHGNTPDAYEEDKRENIMSDISETAAKTGKQEQNFTEKIKGLEQENKKLHLLVDILLDKLMLVDGKNHG